MAAQHVAFGEQERVDFAEPTVVRIAEDDVSAVGPRRILEGDQHDPVLPASTAEEVVGDVDVALDDDDEDVRRVGRSFEPEGVRVLVEDPQVAVDRERSAVLPRFVAVVEASQRQPRAEPSESGSAAAAS
jgi:hypothetical protein